ncbi:MAG: PQQ-dependent sugar dehydrogenase [Gemmatimonadales bacterium]
MTRACRGALWVVLAAAAGACAPDPQRSSVAHADGAAAYVVDTLATGLRNPWSLAFLPDGGMLVTEKFGGLRAYPKGGGTGRTIEGTPAAYRSRDSGLLEIVTDPGFATDSVVYLSFVEGDSAANRTALFRARLDGDRLRDGRVIFRATPDKPGPLHPGGRIAFLPDRTLLLTIGEGFDRRDDAQNLGSDLGKIVRLDRDGRPAQGNPLARSAGARPEIYTYGHRNPQGLLIDPRDGAIWEHEHGPRGGDELNRIEPGSNYGWPLTSFGVADSGEPILPKRAVPKRTAADLVPPVLVWSPSIAPSGFSLYLGSAFPEWSGDFFIGALAGRSLRRVRIRDGKVMGQQTMLRELDARIRDVRTGPDGFLYLLVDAANGLVLRLRPR